MSTTPAPAAPRARRTFDSLPDQMKIKLWTEHEDEARGNWERLADTEKLQKVLDFCAAVEEAALPPAAHRAMPEPWCTPYEPGLDASTGKANDPHDLDHGALAQLPSQRRLFS